jgi:hypothetical protein
MNTSKVITYSVLFGFLSVAAVAES